MIIRKFRKEDTKVVALLVMNTFKRFNKSEFIRKSAVQDYVDYYNPEKNTLEELFERFQTTPIFFVVVDKGRIIGVIRGRPDKITNLFVEGKYHKKGIGKSLVSRFEKEAIKQGSGKIRIRSSLYAASFYEKMGYKKTTGIRNFRGLKIYPMKKIFKQKCFYIRT